MVYAPIDIWKRDGGHKPKRGPALLGEHWCHKQKRHEAFH